VKNYNEKFGFIFLLNPAFEIFMMLWLCSLQRLKHNPTKEICCGVVGVAASLVVMQCL
jgi:hypothetical protein